MFSRKFFGKKYLVDLSIKYLFYSGKFYIFATPMVELAKHIEILLLDNDCVIVPGFGGFMAHHVDAVYDGEEKLFLPPSRTLGFNPQLHINDSLLAQSYVEAYDISYPDAVKRIDAEVSEMRQTINNQGYFELPDIGVIQTNEDGNLEFEPCSAGILTPDLYALTSFEFSEISLLPEKQEETVPTIGIATVATSTQTDNAEVVKPVEEPEVTEVEAEYETEEETENVITIKVSTLKKFAAVAVVLCIIVFAAVPFGGFNIDGLQKSSIDTGLLTKVMPKSQTTTPDELGAIKVINNAVVRTERTDAENKKITESETQTTKSAEKIAESKSFYVIVLASRVAKSNAQSYVNSLKKKGVNDARVIEASNGSKVICGRYSSESEARNGAQELREMSSEFNDAWVMETND